MSSSVILDVILVALLVSYVIYGYRAGLARSVSTVAGITAGAIAAFLVVPHVGAWVPAASWRIAATIGVALALIIVGQSIGVAVGRGLRRRMGRSPLSAIDRALGAFATVVAAALGISVLSASAGALGVPELTRAIAHSVTIRTISQVTPDPVELWLAEARNAAVADGIPLILDAFAGVPPDAPVVDAGTPALAQAAQSVVRITGTAYACGQTQSGTGFVVTADRIITNAHVIAGVDEPVIETLSGQVLAGTVVYFDPTDDLAVVAVSGLNAPPLPMSPNLTNGDTAVVHGYPFGGPFVSTGAEIISVETISASNIYGTDSSPREVYTLAADVREGNSGGPLLTVDGAVTGVIFARSSNADQVGYAMTMSELAPVAEQAPALSQPTSSGECTHG